MNLVTVNRHHKVLSAWAEMRKNSQNAPRLLTLDYHTDTSKPFRNMFNQIYGQRANELEIVQETNTLRTKWLSEINVQDAASITRTISRLNNDEHITTAIQSNIISSALVIAQSATDTNLEVYKQHKIICRAADRKPNSKKVTIQDCNQVLESHFLEQQIQAFDAILKNAGEPSLESEPYILDIDLDYFNTFLSVQPSDSSTIKRLAHNAKLITIATEPEYVLTCSMEKGLTSDFLLEKLRSLF